MNDVKLGDRVVCIDVDNRLVIGNVYTVVYISNDIYNIDLQDDEGNYFYKYWKFKFMGIVQYRNIKINTILE